MPSRASVSIRQRDFLTRAKEGDPDDIVRSLFRLLRTGDPEPLAPEWKSIWASIRDQAYAESVAPSEILESINDAVAELNVVDEGLETLRLSSSDQVCLLLGAGASAPKPSSIPTVAHLLPELWRRAGKIGRDDIDRLSAWCESHDVTNIEDLLTAAHLANFAAKNASVTGLLDYFLFRAGAIEDGEPSNVYGRRRRLVPRVDSSSIALLQDTLQVLFGLLTGTMIPAPPNKGHGAVVEFVKDHPRSSIVTTNYDGCVDEALIRANVALNTYVDESGDSDRSAIDLVKIHGSINWSYCDSCHQVREFPLLDLKLAYETDSTSYAVIGICKNCGGQRRPLLIPPMGLKFIVFPNLIRLWNAARERLEGADYLIVVGFSFSEADTYINKIIERSMTLKETQKLIVCDPNTRLVESLRARFAARIDGFDESRVLAVMGSSDELLPGVLKNLVRPSSPTSQAKSIRRSDKPAPKRKANSSTTRTSKPSRKTRRAARS